MVNHKIDAGLKIAAVCMYEREILELDNILGIVQFSCSTFFRTWQLYQETGNVVKPQSLLACWPHLLVRNDIDYLLQIV